LPPSGSSHGAWRAWKDLEEMAEVLAMNQLAMDRRPTMSNNPYLGCRIMNRALTVFQTISDLCVSSNFVVGRTFSYENCRGLRSIWQSDFLQDFQRIAWKKTARTGKLMKGELSLARNAPAALVTDTSVLPRNESQKISMQINSLSQIEELASLLPIALDVRRSWRFVCHR